MGSSNCVCFEEKWNHLYLRRFQSYHYPYLAVDQYPLPKPSELFACLTGGKKFTKLDLSSAYQKLDEESSKPVTIYPLPLARYLAYQNVPTRGHFGMQGYHFVWPQPPAVLQSTIDEIS